MNRLFQTALQIGKEIRTHTGIGKGATSVGSVAVELAEKIFDRVPLRLGRRRTNVRARGGRRSRNKTRRSEASDAAL